MTGGIETTKEPMAMLAQAIKNADVEQFNMVSSSC
jgi:pyruvoyl-dependent arginine decarboxylase (PvlArgDC)